MRLSSCTVYWMKVVIENDNFIADLASVTY
jgi:hypothetical protein